MIQTILGSKIKMSQIFVDGARIPVTNINAGTCVVVQIKKEDKDGYWAVQLGFGEKKIKNITKPMQGHMKNVIGKDSKVAPRYLREVKLTEEPKYNVGDTVKVSDIFNAGDVVSVTGVSKGKGFAGGVKRWHFSVGPKTQGQSDRQRAPGSIGQGTTPGRVYKGKHMAGRMGNELKTVKNLKVMNVDTEKNEVQVSGVVPGRRGSLIILKKLGVKDA